MSWRPTLRHHVKSVIDLGSRWAHSDTSVCIQHFENLGRGNSSLALALHLIDCARCYAGHAFCHQCQQCTVQHSTRIYAHGLQAHKRLQHDGHDQCSCRRASCLASSSRCKELNTHHGAVPRTTRAGHASLGPRAGMSQCEDAEVTPSLPPPPPPLLLPQSSPLYTSPWTLPGLRQRPTGDAFAWPQQLKRWR